MELEEQALQQAFIDEYCDSMKNQTVGKETVTYQEQIAKEFRPKSNSLFDRATAKVKQAVENVRVAVRRWKPVKKERRVTKTMADIRKEAERRFRKMDDNQRLQFAQYLKSKGKAMKVADNYAMYVADKAERQGAISDNLEEKAKEMTGQRTEKQENELAFQKGYGVGQPAREAMKKDEKEGRPAPREVDFGNLWEKKGKDKQNEKGMGRVMELERDVKAGET